ncbi:hypothetical protein CEE37_02755 [candidate division LCP-89 bacterium B3_LCP]|uniref:Glycosyltransferase RgtA/B/C/D-like domain-containing protein n=1 Tax=candidate division LCP-89 bacterium B3_LCP TaxID=2012998 RepID=A0A532V2X9_UNCL8|nr:MAG: hypothetical protein CEE37_02755 [candidate division LCP-89 bacterium B3_LCP]
MQAIHGNDYSKKRQLIFYLILLALVIWAVGWLLWYEPEQDEVEHWHVAWLMHQGQRPFDDFFEHHSPLLWNILSPIYSITGTSFAVIPISRSAMILVFLLTVLLIRNIAGHWVNPEAAWIAALGFPLYSLSLLTAHLYVRGDPFILLCLVFALWIAIRLLKEDNREKPYLSRLVLIFISLGLAVGFSPRAGLPALTLFLTLFILSLRHLKLLQTVAIFFAGGFIILIPTLIQALIYGFDQYFLWVYRFSAGLYPSFSPVGNLQRILIAAAPICLFSIYGLYRFFRDRDLRRDRPLILMVTMTVVNFFGLWASARPYMQHFLMTIPFFGIMAAIGYSQMKEKLMGRFKPARWNWAAVVLTAGVLVLYTKTWKMHNSGFQENRQVWTERAQWLLDHTDDDATFAAGMAYYQPIFLDDAFHHWFPGRYVVPSMKRLNPGFTPYSLNDLQTASPDVLHESFAEAWGFMCSEDYLNWLEDNYKPTPYRGYWLKKSHP